MRTTVPNGKLRLLLISLHGAAHLQPYTLNVLSIGAAAYESDIAKHLDISLLGCDNNSMSEAELAASVLNRRPDVIGISVFVWNMTFIGRLLPLIRKEDSQVVIVLGGRSVLQFGKAEGRLFHDADLFVCGEGEEVIVDLLRAVLCSGSRQVALQAAKSIRGVLTGPDLDARPKEVAVVDLARVVSPYVPSRLGGRPSFFDTVAGSYDYVWMELSRGCAFRCAFCSYDLLGKGFRPVPTERIRQELAVLSTKNVKRLLIVDSVCGGAKADAIHALQCLEEQPLCYRVRGNTRKTFVHAFFRPEFFDKEYSGAVARSGVDLVQLGLQTVNPAVSPEIRSNNLSLILENVPNLHACSLRCQVDLILGLPGDDLAGLKESVRFVIERMRPLAVRIHKLTVTEGSRLWTMCESRGTSWLRYDVTTGKVLSSYSFSQDDLTYMEAFCSFVMDLYVYMTHNNWLGREEEFRCLDFFERLFDMVLQMHCPEARRLLARYNEFEKTADVHAVLRQLGMTVPENHVVPDIYGMHRVMEDMKSAQPL